MFSIGNGVEKIDGASDGASVKFDVFCVGANEGSDGSDVGLVVGPDGTGGESGEGSVGTNVEFDGTSVGVNEGPDINDVGADVGCNCANDGEYEGVCVGLSDFSDILFPSVDGCGV